ncbi:MAG: hypothetical protein FOGNACKC_06163 [Anaerolineae bacterium]|nr:hypothetical protein [Anaerolineae bacterium]
MLLSMAKVQIIGTKSRRPQTVQTLHRLGVVHIIDWRNEAAPRGVLEQDALQLRENLAYLLTQVQAILGTLPNLNLPLPPQYDEASARPADWLLNEVKTGLAEIEPQAQALARQRAQLEERFSSLPRYEASLRRLVPLVPALVDLEQFTITAIWVERRSQELLASITRQLEDLTEGQCETISGEVDSDLLAAVLVFPKKHAEAVGKLLGQENISRVRLPSEFSGQPLNQVLAEIWRQLEEIPCQIEAIAHEQAQVARQWQSRLLMWQALLRDRLAQIDVCTRLGHTDYTFVLEGWIPQGRVAELTAALVKTVGDEVLVNVLPLSPAEKEAAPVAFDNPAFIKPFEPLVGLLALPKSGGIDPTPLMAVFMPIFFGMILGDVAYGAIILALALYLRHRFKYRDTLRSLTEVLLIGSVWGIFFGFLFGEFFGTLGEEVGLHPLWFDRGHDVESLLLLTIGIGAGHIVLGLSLGVWEAVRLKNRHKLLERGAMLLVLMALFLMVAILTGYLPKSFFSPASALLVVALAVLIYSMGKIGLFLGPLEVIETVGNILSYLRIAAIGLSSIYLAQVANELAGFVGNVVVGVIIAVLFHTLNVALGAFSPTIQSLRLHYVEFFSKFYEGGGQPFRPFRRSM